MNDTTQLARSDSTTVNRAEPQETGQRLTLSPAVDVVENAHGVTLWADLPGVDRDNLEIRVQDGNLRIEASASVPTREGLRLQHAEVRVPYFARSFTLGPEFDTSKIEAKLHDGVLQLSIPRREEARPRRIEVAVG
ncbi:Hsp20/alpha crystallin family protein [Paraburkholderia aromaticivorans]|uniref:Heat-shock protein n=1 Tax=Paraburkholderia aromaticivorans TaxID=2026199 RepID=A0A248VUW6_9BURK|nr:Hsp20/alpha crystallin family protein [Paraburkholderia aromaticivorans]ASW02829.1 heat-shock protein [Paraburkholderia aromaticivorans]